MKCFEGVVQFEKRDICIEKSCLKGELGVCGLKIWLEGHGATVKWPVEYCKEVDPEWRQSNECIL